MAMPDVQISIARCEYIYDVFLLFVLFLVSREIFPYLNTSHDGILIRYKGIGSHSFRQRERERGRERERERERERDDDDDDDDDAKPAFRKFTCGYIEFVFSLFSVFNMVQSLVLGCLRI